MEDSRLVNSQKLSKSIQQLELEARGLNFSERVPYLRLTGNGLVLAYRLPDLSPSGDSNQVICLNIDPLDFRDAPFTILLEGAYEPILSEILLSISKDAKVFVDVGANVGFYSIAVALVSPTCSVHAFEPNPGLWNKLGQNLDLNQVEPRVRLHKYGLDTKTGELDFFIPAETGTGGGSLRNLHPEEGSPEVKTVKVMPFSEVPNKPEPDLVKIDVEGNEKAVVESMLTSISANHPSIIIELLRKWMAPFGNHPMDVATVLLKLGYHMFAISNLGLTEVSFIDESTDETNFLFVHPSREKHLTIAQDYLQKPKVM